MYVSGSKKYVLGMASFSRYVGILSGPIDLLLFRPVRNMLFYFINSEQWYMKCLRGSFLFPAEVKLQRRIYITVMA